MNTCFQLAAYARSQWALAVLLMKSPEATQLAANAFQDAKDAAWGYGWGVSETPHALLSDIPELLNAFNEGKTALQEDMKLAG